MTVRAETSVSDDGENPETGRVDGHQVGPTAPLDPQLAEFTDSVAHFGHVSSTEPGDRVDLKALLPDVERTAGTDVGHAAVLTVHHAALQAVLRHGHEELRRRYLDQLLAGKTLAALAITEPEVSSSNPRMLASKATRDADGWVLDATKSCITAAGWAGLLVTVVPFTVDEGTALTAVAVAADSPGVTIAPREDTIGLRSVPVCGIRFDGVRIEPWQILGEIGGGSMSSAKDS